jgi:hypothetical protein
VFVQAVALKATARFSVSKVQAALLLTLQETEEALHCSAIVV